MSFCTYLFYNVTLQNDNVLKSLCIVMTDIENNYFSDYESTEIESQHSCDISTAKQLFLYDSSYL